MYFLFFWRVFLRNVTGQWIANVYIISGTGGGGGFRVEAGGGFFILKKRSEFGRAGHLLRGVRKFVYCVLSRYGGVGFSVKPCRDNGGILGIKHCNPGNFNHRSATGSFSPSIVAREQVSQTPDILGCVCGISGREGRRSGCAGRNLGVILLICTWGAFSFPSW